MVKKCKADIKLLLYDKKSIQIKGILNNNSICYNKSCKY